VHISTFLTQILFAVQLPVCLYVGVRTARRTGRSILNWLAVGLLAAIVYPPFGALGILVVFLVCPPARPAQRPA